MDLPRATTNSYVQEYRDISLNTKLGKITANFEPIEAKNVGFLTIFFYQNQADLRMARNQQFQLQL